MAFFFFYYGHIDSLAIPRTTWGFFPFSRRRSPTKVELPEVMNMETMEELLNEKKKEAVMDDDAEPADIADRQYKEWLESRFMKEWENGRQK
jgi:hypothetical protein